MKHLCITVGLKITKIQRILAETFVGGLICVVPINCQVREVIITLKITILTVFEGCTYKKCPSDNETFLDSSQY